MNGVEVGRGVGKQKKQFFIVGRTMHEFAQCFPLQKNIDVPQHVRVSEFEYFIVDENAFEWDGFLQRLYIFDSGVKIAALNDVIFHAIGSFYCFPYMLFEYLHVLRIICQHTIRTKPLLYRRVLTQLTQSKPLTTRLAQLIVYCFPDLSQQIDSTLHTSNNLQSTYYSQHQHMDQLQINPPNVSLTLIIAVNKVQKQCGGVETFNDQVLTQQNQRHSIKVQLMRCSLYFQISITCLTVISLFLSDVAAIAIPQDVGLDQVYFIIFSLFSIEIVLSTSLQGYFGSFFFYLDVLSTVTILLDVQVITNMISGGSTLPLNSIITQSKASRAAARAVRITKIFRLARVVKAYNSAKRARELKQEQKKVKPKSQYHSDNQNSVSQPPRMEEEDRSHAELKNEVVEVENQVVNLQGKESNISKILSEDTIKKIIIIIFCIMFSIPLLDPSNYFNSSTGWDSLAAYISYSLSYTNISLQDINATVYASIDLFNSMNYNSQLISIVTPFANIPSIVYQNASAYSVSDMALFSCPINMTLVAAQRNLTLNAAPLQSIDILITYAQLNRINAGIHYMMVGFAIGTTIFICLTITFLLSEFSKHITSLIIAPIERMLASIREESVEEKDAEEHEEYETIMVYNAILKIKALMCKIFGTGGTELVHEKLFSCNTLLDVLQEKPRRVHCVYALAAITHATDIAAILHTEIFEFVNNLAWIVHRAAYRYGGHCLENHFDSFLLVFKLNQNSNVKMSIQSDFAVFSAIKALVRLRKEPRVLKYRNEQKLLMRFGSRFNVSMQFVLTAGIAYQGILGSNYKIDPVIMSDATCALKQVLKACTAFEDIVILTGELHTLLSHGLKKYCRRFDVLLLQNKLHQLFIIQIDLANVTSSRAKGEKDKQHFQSDQQLLNYKRSENMIWIKNSSQLYNMQVYSRVLQVYNRVLFIVFCK